MTRDSAKPFNGNDVHRAAQFCIPRIIVLRRRTVKATEPVNMIMQPYGLLGGAGTSAPGASGAPAAPLDGAGALVPVSLAVHISFLCLVSVHVPCMGVPFFSYEQGSPADLSWQAILRAFFEDPWAGATVVTANSASAAPIRIVRFILCSLLQFFSKFRTFFSLLF